jgi:hypothetical protein
MVTSTEDFLLLRRDWERIQSCNGEENYYYSFDWYDAICHFCREPYCSLFILSIQDDDDGVVAIFPLWIVRKRPRFLTFNSLEFIGNIYSAYRGGIVLGGKEREAAAAAVQFILSRKKLWDIAYLEGLPQSAPLLSALEEAFREASVVTRKVEQYANIVVDNEPGQSSADYWKSRRGKLRHEVRRYLNRSNRDGKAVILLTRDPEQNVCGAMDHYEEIYRCSWKPAECDPLFHRNLAEHLAGRGKLRLFTLYFKQGEAAQGDDGSIPVREEAAARYSAEGYLPVATAYCAVNGSYSCMLKTAYRQDYDAYSFGTLLTWHVIQWLLDQEKATVIDFQKDGDAYKYKWGRFRDMHLLLKAASPASPLAMVETLGEKVLIPALRKIGWMKTPDFAVIPKPDASRT